MNNQMEDINIKLDEILVSVQTLSLNIQKLVDALEKFKIIKAKKEGMMGLG